MKIFRLGITTMMIVFFASPVARAQEESQTEVVLPSDDAPAEEEYPAEMVEETNLPEPTPLPNSSGVDAPEPSSETAPVTSQYDNTGEPELTEDTEEEEEEDESVFSWFSLAPEVGYVFYPQAKMTVQGFSATVKPRNGFLAKVHLDLGGDGFAFEFAPLFAIEAGGIDSSGGSFGDASIDLSQGLMSGSFQAIGAQLSLVYRFKIGRYFFPNFGLSFHGTYLMGKEIDYGTEIYGRIPLGFTVYMGPHVGLVFEVGLMYGVTGIKTPLVLPEIVNSMDPAVVAGLEDCRSPADINSWYNSNQDYINQWIESNENLLPQDYNTDKLVQDFVGDQLGESIRYGAGFGIDITIGLRFP